MMTSNVGDARKSRRVRRFEEKLRKRLAKLSSGQVDRIGRMAEKELRKHTGGVSGLCFNGDHAGCYADPEIREGCLCRCHMLCPPCPVCKKPLADHTEDQIRDHARVNKLVDEEKVERYDLDEP